MQPFDDPSADPIAVFNDWLAEAGQTELNDPNAMALATASPTGVPSVRIVLLKGSDARGLRFFTNAESHKGHELHDNPVAALCFHWKSLRRQVRFEGSVVTLDRGETEKYFHSRSRGSQIAAAVSSQSRPLPSRDALDQAVRTYTEQLGAREVPLPESWAGFLLEPTLIEFWADGKDRLHDRVQFTRNGVGWSTVRLYP